VWLLPHQLVAAELPADRDRVQSVVDEFRARLSIPQDIQVSIVATNTLLVSVQRQAGNEGFLLAFEEAFLRQLNEEEIRAVVAHELGHVWIFTHHPYLQTEQLANGIAMRLVTRESLEPIYEKVWKRVGATGDIGRYLGDQPSTAADTASASVNAGFTSPAAAPPSTPIALPAGSALPDTQTRSEH
jgi:hypothetical protein